MLVSQALKILADIRTTQIVVTTMGATREWSQLSESALDFHYLPSAMGHAPMIALGVALAHSDREVIVLNGDGSMLMNLGCLVTIMASGIRNLTVLLLENGVYEVTGGQRTPAAAVPVDYAAIARGAGFPTVAQFENAELWRRNVAEFLQSTGPRFVSLRVELVREDYVPQLKTSIDQRILQFQQALGVRREAGEADARPD